MLGRRRAERRDEELTMMSAAGLSFAFAGPAGAVADEPTPMWRLPTQSAAPVEESYDDAMDELVDIDDIPALVPAVDDRAARILRLRGRF